MTDATIVECSGEKADHFNAYRWCVTEFGFPNNDDSIWKTIFGQPLWDWKSQTYRWKFMFDNEEDALLFKLTWAPE